MERKHVFILLGCMLLMTAVLAALYASSSLKKEVFRGEFVRNFIHEPSPAEARVMDLKFNSYYISGAMNDEIYLSNYTAPLHLLKTNFALTDSQHVKIELEGIAWEKITKPGVLRTKVAPPYFFIDHGEMAELLRGKVGTWKVKRFMPDSGFYFSDATPISGTSFALRCYSNAEQGYQLARKTSIDTPYFQFKHGLLEKQIDGLFCVEGMLHYNKEMNQLIYLYSYRNEYLIMDTLMNLVSKGNTIDPFIKAQVKTAHIESSNTTMLAAPPPRVNQMSCVDGEYLYVQSNVPSKSEDIEKFNAGTVIDVYDLNTRTYSHSFYLGSYKNEKVMDFRAVNGHVVCLYGQSVVVYKLNQPG